VRAGVERVERRLAAVGQEAAAAPRARKRLAADLRATLRAIPGDGVVAREPGAAARERDVEGEPAPLELQPGQVRIRDVPEAEQVADAVRRAGGHTVHVVARLAELGAAVAVHLL